MTKYSSYLTWRNRAQDSDYQSARLFSHLGGYLRSQITSCSNIEPTVRIFFCCCLIKYKHKSFDSFVTWVQSFDKGSLGLEISLTWRPLSDENPHRVSETDKGCTRGSIRSKDSLLRKFLSKQKGAPHRIIYH